MTHCIAHLRVIATVTIRITYLKTSGLISIPRGVKVGDNQFIYVILSIDTDIDVDTDVCSLDRIELIPNM